MYHFRRCLWSCVALLGGCATSEVLIPHQVELAKPRVTPAEEALLDVAIVAFDAGLPEQIDAEERERLAADGVHVNVRRAESVQMAVQLERSLRRSGHWGAVWLAPQPSLAADVNVVARILESDGYVVRVAVTVVDATGRQWFDERYELETAAAAYDRERHAGLDPYQDIFNAIANDMAAALVSLSAAAVHRIKTVAALRYAAELSPEAFGGYLVLRRSGHEPVRLPARDDPMLDRVLRVRERERLFLETLDRHYEELATAAEQSYDGWRASSREESIAIREFTRTARWRTALGITAMLAAMANGHSNAFVQTGMATIGTELLKMRTQDLRGRELHAAALDELAASYDEEIAPLVVELAGTEHRLTGTAAAQYDEWRQLLRQLFVAEMGLDESP